MPAKRRKAATHPADSHEPATPESPSPLAAGPDVFDHAIAARDGATVIPAPEESPPEAAAKAFQPDPFPVVIIPLGAGRDAPAVRLFRSRRMNQVAVRFDDKPAEPVRQRLRDEGYKWREAEGVWTKQLGDHKATGQLAAERLVDEIANGVRAEGGLPPVGRTPGG